MRVLIVTYDLKDPQESYAGLIQKIRAYAGWARLGESAYLIATDKTVIQVRDDLVLSLGQNDQLFVGSCPIPAAWNGLPDDVAKWIQENQPKATY